MKKAILSGLLACLLLLSACAPAKPNLAKEGLSIAATTWPVYCLATAVTQGVEEITVTAVITDQVSCLHDYTLTVNSMKIIEGADIVVMNGLGLEDFMSAALNAANAAVIDSSVGVTTLKLPDRGDDPHIWMDPNRAALMVQNMADGFAKADPAHAEAYQANADAAVSALKTCADEGVGLLAPLADRALITFHDGFGYFADSFGLTMLKSIEEEEGSEASAREISEIVALVRDYNLPAIFTEVNGSDATAKAIARETGVAVETLTMIMSGEGTGIQPYLDAMEVNLNTVRAALGGMGAAE